MAGDNCPKSCGHKTFHYCNESGSHCDKHCVCTCKPCEEDRKNPAPVGKSGGKILGATVVGDINTIKELFTPVKPSIEGEKMPKKYDSVQEFFERNFPELLPLLNSTDNYWAGVRENTIPNSKLAESILIGIGLNRFESMTFRSSSALLAARSMNWLPTPK